MGEIEGGSFKLQKVFPRHWIVRFVHTLAPIWFPHCPAWMWTISRILTSTGTTWARTERRWSRGGRSSGTESASRRFGASSGNDRENERGEKRLNRERPNGKTSKGLAGEGRRQAGAQGRQAGVTRAAETSNGRQLGRHRLAETSPLAGVSTGLDCFACFPCRAEKSFTLTHSLTHLWLRSLTLSHASTYMRGQGEEGKTPHYCSVEMCHVRITTTKVYLY